MLKYLNLQIQDCSYAVPIYCRTKGELEKTLSRRFNRTVKIVGAGRTDAGVHARGQAIHFDVYPHEVVAKGDIDDGLDDCGHFCRQLQRSLNGMLEQDMRVYNITKSPPPVDFKLRDGSVRKLKWHVIYSAERKLYTYRISLKPKSVTADPMQRYTRVHVDGNLDPEYLQNILHHYEGEHDFRAFAGAIEANQRKQGIGMKDTVRTVYSIKLIDEENGNYRIEILLKGALYKMVRNMVGTALDVSMGRLDENAMLQMLNHSPDEGEAPKQFVRKDNKCKPAPPEGLTLEKVYFDDDDF